jgi:histidyl-tRNA synthetase
MTQQVRAIRGMNDVLPPDSDGWLHIEDAVRRLLESYGYRQIRVPIVEYTDLFKRSIGDATDIVEKEMYTFDDRNGDSLTLRPEATAGIVRAAITNGLLHNQKHKLWTVGPMFRYERPQKGRYRQFHQIDVEAFGYDGPDIDAEMILMSARLWRRLGIGRIRLEINSLGTAESRHAYRTLLVDYFEGHRDALDDDSLRRLGTNPLRILDSKNPEMADVVAGAPVLTEHLDAESAEHFAGLQDILRGAEIEFTVNPRLVRGLDYYSRTVFEWVTDALGAQGAVCSGGRYDGLVEHLGGKAVPAIGWAIGVERLIALYTEERGAPPVTHPHAYFAAVGERAALAASHLAETLRDRMPALRLEMNLGGGSFKAQLKRADKSGAAVAIILGEDELDEGLVSVKPLRSDEPQQRIAQGQLAELLADATGLQDTGGAK